MQKCGNHWCRLGTSQVVNSSLTNGTSSKIVSLIETYKYNNCSSWITQNKGENKGTNSCSVAGNGLMYDNCQGGLGRNLSSASSYCSSKGMRLPAFSETRAGSGSGVPSCASWSWTSTTVDNYYYKGWNGTQSAWDRDKWYTNYYVRCVK